MTWARELVENNSVETKRNTMAELYELRRLIIRHARSMPPGPARNERRQIAAEGSEALLLAAQWRLAEGDAGHDQAAAFLG